jgi:oxygen-independent coproporphyrinogen III oxidase
MKIREELALKYNFPVPRYTSYPPANKFAGGFDGSDFLGAVEESNSWSPSNVSFYIHIPYCKKLCFYCGCNSCRAKDLISIDNYFRAMSLEIEAVTKRIGTDRKISQIHFGGGTPNSVPVSFLKEIIAKLSHNRSFIDMPEIAIECHPGLLDPDYVAELKRVGFNRFSLGIQDLNNGVLKLVNRDPSLIPVDKLISAIRRDSSIAVNLDFIYGLPGQTPESFARTIEEAAAMRPDRLVTFSYAHVPWVNRNQMKLEKHGLPDMMSKLRMFENTHLIMSRAGYRPVGLDHFVQEDDELSLASVTGDLHRNFQGYCTRRTTGQVYAFGSSGISQLGKAYFQTARDPDEYSAALLSGCIPVEKGYILSEGELFVREAIDSLMCNRRLNLKEYISGVERLFDFTPDRARLAEFEGEGITEMSGDTLHVTEDGTIFIRNVAASLDPLFKDYVMSFSKPV